MTFTVQTAEWLASRVASPRLTSWILQAPGRSALSEPRERLTPAADVGCQSASRYPYRSATASGPNESPTRPDFAFAGETARRR